MPAREAVSPGVLSDADLAHIAAGASTPRERLAPTYAPRGDGDGPDEAARRHRWSQHVGKGDPAIFERVLGWRGMDVAAWHAALGPVDLADPPDLPEWTDDLRRIVADLPRPTGTPPYLDPAEPFPHEDLFVPFVEAASRAPLARLRAMGASPGALTKLQRRLLLALTHVAAPALGTPGATRDFPRGAFLDFPVLARLVARYRRNWEAAVGELLDRLDADRAPLAAFLGLPALPPLAGMHVEDADGHDGGRTVVTVSFEGGARVVYKPRDMALDLAFGRLLDWLGARGLDLEGAVPRVLAREGYGWAAFVVRRHAADEAERAAFWHGAGMLMGVLTALGGNDMHHGNVIAAGPRLVAVDLETVLRPPIRPPAEVAATDRSALARLAAVLAASPIGTCMGPTILHGGGGVYVDLGALTAQGGADAPHRASAGPVEDEIRRHHGALEAGLLRAMRAMRENAADLAAPDGPLAGFAGCSVRLVFRDTNTYFRLLKMSCDAPALRDGADRDVALERLARMLAPFAEPPPYVGIVEAEKRAMDALDIPRFDAPTDGVDLRDAGGVVVPGMFSGTTVEEARSRVLALTPEGEAIAARVLGLSLQARLVGTAAPGAQEPPDVAGDDPTPAAPLDGARRIGAILAEHVVRGEDGGLAWICPAHRVKEGFMTLAGANLGLGDGCLGVAVFLAALARATGDPEVAALRDGAAFALRPRGSASGYRSLVAPPTGLVDGFAGQVWGLTALARLGGGGWCIGAAAEAWRLALDGTEESPALADGTGGLLLAGLALDALSPGAAEGLRRLADRVAGAAHALSAGADAEGGLMQGLTGAGHALALAAARLGAPDLAEVAVTALALPAAEQPGWGRGAAGRVLALRAALDAVPDEPRLAPMLAAESAALLAMPLPPHDGVWNGRAGIVAALAAAGDPARAASLAGTLAGRATAGRLRTVLPALPGVVVPGLLNGVAGVGYALLREATPDLPDLLTFR